MPTNFSKVGIVGCGLMGGSIAKDCVAGGMDVHIVSKNKEEVVKYIPSATVYDTVDKLPSCDLIVIAIPLSEYDSVLEGVKRGKHKVITDIGSVRGYVDKLVEGIENFVGSHPIAGKECSGIENSQEGLFVGKKVIVLSDDSRGVEDFWQGIGGIVEHMNSLEHDRVYGALSHFTHAIAFTFDDLVKESQMVQKDHELSSKEEKYRQFRRIGIGTRDIWHGNPGILKANKGNVQGFFDHFKKAADAETVGDSGTGMLGLAHRVGRCFSKALTDAKIDLKKHGGGSALAIQSALSLENPSADVCHRDFELKRFVQKLNNNIDLL